MCPLVRNEVRDIRDEIEHDWTRDSFCVTEAIGGQAVLVAIGAVRCWALSETVEVHIVGQDGSSFAKGA